eukprot:m51a1_g9513 hypothetical protein (285) ;mRNA; r:710999-724768
MKQDKKTEQQNGDAEQQNDAEAEQQDKQQDKQQDEQEEKNVGDEQQEQEGDEDDTVELEQDRLNKIEMQVDHCVKITQAFYQYISEGLHYSNLFEFNSCTLEVCKMSCNMKNMLAQYNNTAENMVEQFRAQNMNLQTFQNKMKLNLGVEITVEQWAAFEKAHRQYLTKKRGRSHFNIGDYVLLDKDRDHKLDINVRGPFCVIKKLDHHCYTIENLLQEASCTHDEMALDTVLHHRHVSGKLKLRVRWLGCPDFRYDDSRSWISYDDKNIDQVVTYMQAHPHLQT